MKTKLLTLTLLAGSSLFAGVRRRIRGCWSAASACSRVCPTALSWSGLCLGRGLLVSLGTALRVACGLLGAAAISGRVLGSSAILRRPILSRVLAPLAS